MCGGDTTTPRASPALSGYSPTHCSAGFAFNDCDPLADFARRAFEVTRDQVILREAIRGLAALGWNHNRWHVRDVAVGLLQSVREDDAAVSALEGLRMAGPRATEWTAGPAVAGTLHPILRVGIAQILSQPGLMPCRRPKRRTFKASSASPRPAGLHHNDHVRHPEQCCVADMLAT